MQEQSDLLTKRKAAWVANFKPDQLRGPPLTVPFAVSNSYYKKLAALIDRMATEVKRQLSAFYDRGVAKEYFESDESVSSQARILTNSIVDKITAMFEDAAPQLSENLVDQVNKSSNAALIASLDALTGGASLPVRQLTPDLREVMKASITENVSLIKSIPSQYLTNIQGQVMRSITTGNGLADLVPYLAKQKNITLRRARLIANDQTSKAYSAMNRNKMINAGIKEFEWRHTPGERYPRPEHVAMNGKIYSFDDPPVIDSKTGERGFPGQLINCNCRMMPVIRFKGEPETEDA